MIKPSKRLRKAMGAGDSIVLFSMIKNWPKDELQALIKDADEFATAVSRALDEEWRKQALKPGAFFSKALSKKVDSEYKEAQMKLLAVMSEICSVAIFLLDEHGVKN